MTSLRKTDLVNRWMAILLSVLLLTVFPIHVHAAETQLNVWGANEPKLFTWGDNTFGQLGDGTMNASLSPVEVFFDPAPEWMDFAAGGGHNVAVDVDGNLWSWGSNNSGELGDSSNETSTTPKRIEVEGIQWASVYAASSRSGALDVNGGLWLWGNNGNGQIGDGTVISRNVPIKVTIESEPEWQKIALGGIHTIALDINGNLWGWGSNFYDELAQDATASYPTPQLLPINQGVWVDISAGSTFTLALDKDGNIWSWGQNNVGQLGLGFNSTKEKLPQKIAFVGAPLWESIYAGTQHSLALDTEGNLWAWGSNSFGQLGDGTNTSKNFPTRVMMNAEPEWEVLSPSNGATLNSYFNLALDTQGRLWGWGSNVYGQLGDGTTQNKNSPTQIGDGTGWIGVGAGHRNSIALKGESLDSPGDILYVKEGSVGNGSSWENAFGTLQQALDVVQADQAIWVAQGTYYPTKHQGFNSNPSDPRDVSFQMKNNVSIYGGFMGNEGEDFNLDNRDFKANETVLSGDIGVKGVASDNAYNVFRHPDLALNQTAVLDGFTITGGNANFSAGGSTHHSNGGGIHNNNNSSPTLRNIVFRGNKASENGGGMYNIANSNPTLEKVSFIDNEANRVGGGGVFNQSSHPTFINVIFIYNSAHTGGGVVNDGSSPTFINTTFHYNIADNAGGIFNTSGSHPTIVNTIMVGNLSHIGIDSMENLASTPFIQNSLIAGAGESGDAWVDYFGIDGGGNIHVDPEFMFPWEGGPIDINQLSVRLQETSPAINKGTNIPYQSGGAAFGITTDLDGNPRIVGSSVDMGAYEYQGILEEHYRVTFGVKAGAGSITASIEGETPILSGDEVVAGSHIVFYAEPEGQYKVKDWLINGISQGITDESYAIENLQGNVDVLVELKVEENDGGDGGDGDAQGVLWLSPIVLEKFTVNNGSTLPIKFALMDDEGRALTQQQSVTLAVYGPEQGLVTSWKVGDGLIFELDEENDHWFYQGNLETRNLNLEDGMYQAVVYGLNSEPVSTIFFDIRTSNQNRGRSNH